MGPVLDHTQGSARPVARIHLLPQGRVPWILVVVSMSSVALQLVLLADYRLLPQSLLAGPHLFAAAQDLFLFQIRMPKKLLLQ